MNLVDGVRGSSVSSHLPGALWCLVIFLERSHREVLLKAAWKELRLLIQSVMMVLEVNLGKWALLLPPVGLQTMVSTQGGNRRPKKWSCLVQSIANQLRRPELSKAEQAEGRKKGLSADQNIRRGNDLYLQCAARCFQDCFSFELVLDSSPFGSKDSW